MQPTNGRRCDDMNGGFIVSTKGPFGLTIATGLAIFSHGSLDNPHSSPVFGLGNLHQVIFKSCTSYSWSSPPVSEL